MEQEIIEDAYTEAEEFWENRIKDWYKNPEDAKKYAKAFIEKLKNVMEQ